MNTHNYLSRFRFKLIFVLLALALLVVIILGRCVPEPPGKGAEQYFVEDEVIIIGPDEQAILNEITTYLPNYQLTLQETIGLPLSNTGVPKEVIQLYKIQTTGATTPASGSVVSSVVDLINADQTNLLVRADPNYFIYLHDSTSPVSAQPWSIGSAPWSIGSGPNGPGTRIDGSLLIQHQWALGEQGIGLYTSSNWTRQTTYTGDGVRVGIFDTSPLTGTNPWIDEHNGDFRVTFYDWQELRSDPHATNASENVLALNNHGLFVASLVNAVAPSSSIYLIRTLNDNGVGTLFGLYSDIQDFIDRVPPTPSHKTVINLSLGIPETEMVNRGNSSSPIVCPSTPTQTRKYRKDINIHTFSCYIDSLVDSGVVIVASAGNDSTDPNDPQEPEYPASYSFVIGVEASTRSGTRSCFSNLGNVTAPGGQGGPQGDRPCAPQLFQCSQSLLENENYDRGSCEYGLVGRVSASNERHFAWWAGTSFSAPLVSGLAALALEAGIPPAEVEARLHGPTSNAVNANNLPTSNSPTP